MSSILDVLKRKGSHGNNIAEAVENLSGGGELTPATADTLGGVKIGDGIDVTEDGTISANGGGSNDYILKFWATGDNDDIWHCDKTFAELYEDLSSEANRSVRIFMAYSEEEYLADEFWEIHGFMWNLTPYSFSASSYSPSYFGGSEEKYTFVLFVEDISLDSSDEVIYHYSKGVFACPDVEGAGEGDFLTWDGYNVEWKSPFPYYESLDNGKVLTIKDGRPQWVMPE